MRLARSQLVISLYDKLLPTFLRSLPNEVSICNTSQSLISEDEGLTTALLQAKQVRRHLPTVRCEAWRD